MAVLFAPIIADDIFIFSYFQTVSRAIGKNKSYPKMIRTILPKLNSFYVRKGEAILKILLVGVLNRYREEKTMIQM